MTTDAAAPAPAGLTVDAACARAGVSKSTLYRAVRAGRLDIRTVGPRSVVDLEKFNAWVSAREADTEALRVQLR